MSVIKFDIDSKIVFEDIEYKIKAFPSPSKVLLKQTNPPYKKTIVKVNDLIKESANSKELDKSFVDVEPKDFDKALERFKVIESLIELENRTANDVKKVAKIHKKGIATVYRWLTTFEKYGTVSSLSPNRENCGGKGRSRLSSSVDAVIDAVIEEFYLTKQQHPLSTIYREVVKGCNYLGVKAPAKNTIRNKIDNIHPKLIAKRRRGLKVNETRGMPGSFPDVKMPLDVIQIDHTKVDVILVDEETRQAIGRPFITVAIDVYSRMVYGFYISLEAINYFSAGQCLLNAIMPKDEILKEHDISGEWPVFGLPRVVSMDNSKEFRSVSLQSFCQEFRIADVYRPVGRSHFGGIIERLIGTLMDKTHEIPGSTFSSILEKGTYDSEGNACMTIIELEKWYLDFIVNIYHKTEHISLEMTPEEKFYQGFLGVGDNTIPFLPTVPADSIKLRMALFPKLERKVQKNGITIDYVTYFSETLRKWIIPSQYKKLNPKFNNTVICRRDPRDISKIYVYDEDIKDYIVVPYADIRKPAMNLKELRESISEAKKAVTGREIESYDIFEAYDRLHQYVENSKKEMKSVRRKQSSKRHQKKTIELDKKVLKDSVEQREQIRNRIVEDEDDGYEIYPID